MSSGSLAAEALPSRSGRGERTVRTRRWSQVAAVAGAAVAGALALADGAGTLEVARLVVLGGAVAAIAVYDGAERRIPNRIVLPAAGVCAALAIAGGAERTLLWSLILVALLLALSLGRPGTVGMGDVKLVLLIALGFGGHALPALLLGFALAAAVGLLLLVRDGRAAWRASLPLAPFLAAGVFGVLLGLALAY